MNVIAALILIALVFIWLELISICTELVTMCTALMEIGSLFRQLAKELNKR